MAQFYPLSVADVRRETRDAVVVTLMPRDEDRPVFDFIQGQYLTFRRLFDGEELRRSYSICAARGEPALKVGIKRVDGGCFSTWANEDLKVGDVLEAMPPMGSFHSALEPERAKTYLGFAGGSGITPLLSIIKTVLTAEPKSDFTLVYGNRSINAIMFREELEDLKNLYLGRLNVIHVLESEAQDIDLFAGRVDADKCAALFGSWIQVEKADQAFICGPEPMMLAVSAALRAHGMPENRVKFELFASGQPGRARRRAAATGEAEKGDVCTATITVDGATRVVEMPKHGQSLLEAALGADLDAPYACKAGICSTCRAMVVEGEVEMEANYALEDYEVRRGYVLTCQCYPVTDRVVVDYDR
ncbi:1,2-phenylacetyl-CoA epoxidase subunit PaaE [Polymorphum gilvum]|uniref:Putative ferredoxin reductase electron transfer component protein n=1 Tax=Polymorphum gilvum (strain LMG 25793 / CGMCC 1.9160 / SL003B-26A1) TaxID=991905 RepID=F2IYV9_POLGS|nr:1,2-phenylacetyl-CoA epoxidase subunit PaaE [Polymorphum gilvum]ADZ70574.1 Putative ferredoxin reductase electron transfer component protein [Polymorphum gilvum SL003B-26A1]